MIKKWWMESVGYQIYPKSFYDSNADGIGDLQGITEKLTYLHDLGVNLIWIGPFYDSPMDDNGYDVRDFYKVDQRFGTLEDVKQLIHRAHELDIKVIFDFVLNHTSDEHEWFMASRKSKDNPYRDYYIWHDGKTKDGKRVEPTNWGSFFGGSAWKYDEPSDSYYMKIFSDKMPDLNWKNPKVHEEMIKVGEFWLDIGVDGFRIDAVSHLDRAAFEDIDDETNEYPLDWHRFSNLPKVHDYLQELNQKLFKPHNILTIGEVGGQATIEDALKYAGFDANELSMVFNFDHNWCNNLSEVTNPKKLEVDVIHLRQVFMKWQDAFKDKGWLPLNWLNHDQPRLISHYGHYKYPIASGKMLATLIHMMRGTPFIYQGEEIGMTNYPFQDVRDFDDQSSVANYYYQLEHVSDNPVYALKIASLRSRDNGRTPMQWDKSRAAGFTKGIPWFHINPNYKKINVYNSIKDEDSLWHHYQALINLRRHSKYHDVITYGKLTFIDIEDDEHLSYIRSNDQQMLLVINSFSAYETSYDLSAYDMIDIVLNNDKKTTIKDEKIILKPFQSVVLEVKVKA